MASSKDRRRRAGTIKRKRKRLRLREAMKFRIPDVRTADLRSPGLKAAQDEMRRRARRPPWPIRRNLIAPFGPAADIFLRTQLMAIRIVGLAALTAVILGTYRVLRRRMRDNIDAVAIFYMMKARSELKPGGYKRGPRGGKVADPPAQAPHIYNRTGRLSKSLRARSKIETDSFTLTVTNTAPYAAALEFGTRHIQARSWMVNTFNKNKSKMMAIATVKAKRPITDAELNRRL